MKGDKFKRDPDKALRLSKLEPDADKDFEGIGFTNIAGISPSMALGDVVFRGVSLLRPLAPGMVGYVLVSAGPGRSPYWAPISSSSEKWISARIELDLFSNSAIVPNHASEAGSLGVFVEDQNYLYISDNLNLANTENLPVVTDESLVRSITVTCGVVGPV